MGFGLLQGEETMGKVGGGGSDSQGRFEKNQGEKPPVFLSLSGPDYALNDLLFVGFRANMSVPKER